jgi:SAM-dependent methyltransferase
MINKVGNTAGLPEPDVAQRYLCCPIDLGELDFADDRLRCQVCGASFPVVGRRAVLVDEERSVFRNADLARAEDHRQFPPSTGWKARLRRLLPASGTTRENVDHLSKVGPYLEPGARILVIGCGFTRSRFVSLFPDAEVVLTDVTLQGDADIACDGQCLPFKTGSMSLIVLDQVLEHVVDVNAVLAEAERCLKPGGLVYSGVPFYFPNHGFPFDFRRFTPLGHRLLYPRFEGLGLWTTGGPLGALSLAAIGAGTAVHENVQWRRLVSMSCRMLLRPVAGLDRVRPWDRTTIALGSVFIGRKGTQQRKFQELLEDVRKLSAATQPR